MGVCNLCIFLVLLASSLSAATSSRFATAPDGSPVPLVNLNGTFYYFETNLRVNWFAASDFCRRLGLHLVVIESSEENYLIKQHLTSLGVSWQFWIGASDLAALNSWVWQPTGNPVQFTDWTLGEPDHQGAEGYAKERAVTLWNSRNFEWNDASPFNWEGHFICEETPCVPAPAQ